MPLAALAPTELQALPLTAEPDDALVQLAQAAEHLGAQPGADDYLNPETNWFDDMGSRSSVLDYARPGLPRRVRGTGLDRAKLLDLVQRLERIEPGEPSQPNGWMSSCPHCDSTIASFVGRCPYCRHPLHGG